MLDERLDCYDEYDFLTIQEKMIDKNFRREFNEYTSSIVDQLYRLFRRRPKMHQRILKSVLFLTQLAHCITSGIIPSYYPLEIFEFCAAMSKLDGASSTPEGVSVTSWSRVCALRRRKLDYELKVKVMALQLAEIDHLVSVYIINLTAEREKEQHLLGALTHIRGLKLNACHNIQLQLLVNQGMVEMPGYGTVEEFSECVLMNRDIIEKLNVKVEAAGKEKIKLMKKVVNAHRILGVKQWHHQLLRMEIEDLMFTLDAIETLEANRITRIVTKKVAANEALETLGAVEFDIQIRAFRLHFRRRLKEFKDYLDEVNDTITELIIEDRNVRRGIVTTNVWLNDKENTRDHNFPMNREAFRWKRFRAMCTRWRRVKLIQKQRQQILLLQTELELLRLKTYPTLNLVKLT